MCGLDQSRSRAASPQEVGIIRKDWAKRGPAAAAATLAALAAVLPLVPALAALAAVAVATLAALSPFARARLRGALAIRNDTHFRVAQVEPRNRLRLGAWQGRHDAPEHPAAQGEKHTQVRAGEIDIDGAARRGPALEDRGLLHHAEGSRNQPERLLQYLNAPNPVEAKKSFSIGGASS